MQNKIIEILNNFINFILKIVNVICHRLTIIYSCITQIFLIFLRNRLEEFGHFLEFVAKHYSQENLTCDEKASERKFIADLLRLSQKVRNYPKLNNLFKEPVLNFYRAYLYLFFLMLYVLYRTHLGYYDMSSLINIFHDITDVERLSFIFKLVVIDVFAIIGFVFSVFFNSQTKIIVEHKITSLLLQIKNKSILLYYSVVLVSIYILTKIILLIFVILCSV